MKEDTLKPSVQYKDYEGEIAADEHDQIKLDYIANKYGVDTSKYFVFGVEVYLGEFQGDELIRTMIDILVVDIQAVGADIDSIQKYIDEHHGILPYRKFIIETSFDEILQSFKRFNVVIRKARIKQINSFRLIENT